MSSSHSGAPSVLDTEVAQIVYLWLQGACRYISGAYRQMGTECLGVSHACSDKWKVSRQQLEVAMS